MIANKQNYLFYCCTIQAAYHNGLTTGELCENKIMADKDPFLKENKLFYGIKAAGNVHTTVHELA